MSKKSKRARERLRLKEKRKKQQKIFFGVVEGIILVLVVILFIFLSREKGGDIIDYGEAPISEQKDSVEIPISSIDDGDLHYYSYFSGSTEIKYFVVKGSDGKIHTAFDTCSKLHKPPQGWKQEGDYVVCRDEGCYYPINSIGTGQPGCCWPMDLSHSIEDEKVMIKITDIESGNGYFK